MTKHLKTDNDGSPARYNNMPTYRGVEILKKPLYHSKQKLMGEQLRHAVEVGTIDGVVPEGMESYNESIHGHYDMDAFRKASLKGYNNYYFAHEHCPKIYLEALAHGFDNHGDWFSGGPENYLKAVRLGYDPKKNATPGGSPGVSPGVCKKVANYYSNTNDAFTRQPANDA